MKQKNVFSRLCAGTLAAMLCITSAQAVNVRPGRTDKYILASLQNVTCYNSQGNEMNVIAGTTLTNAESFSALLSLFDDPTTDSKVQDYYKSTNPDDGYAFTSESSFALLMADKKSLTHQVSEKLEVNNRSVQIGTANVYDTVKFQFENGLSVENGGLLFQNSSTANSAKYSEQNIEIVLGQPITVGSGGRLVLEGAPMGAVGNGIPDGNIPKQSELIAPENASAIQIQDGGQADIVHFVVKRGDDDTSSAPLIEVASGAELNFLMGGNSLVGEDGLPVFAEDTQNADERAKVDLNNGSSDSPAVSVAENATVNLKAGDFTASGDGAIFDLADGATLNLEGGTITSESETPAITVGSGATVVIPEDSKAEIKSEGGNAAIDLAPGASVQQGGNTITVAPVEDESASNYVDNHGNVVLASGGTRNDVEIPSNTVITEDGTAISGKNDLPTVDSEGNVTVPEGGATITNPDGDKVEVGNNAEIPSIVIGVKDAETGKVETSKRIELCDGTLALETAVFDSEIDLKDYTCTVASDKETVATAELKDGKIVVTPVSTGTATITATYTKNSGAAEGIALLDEGEATAENDLTATFTVEVYKESSGGGGGGGSSSSTTYAVSVEDSKNGSVSVSPKRAEKGDTVTITVKPDTGYELDELIVTDKNGDKIKLTEKDDNKFTFKMPGSKVTVETSFKLIETEPENPFTDISKSDYFYDAVLWAADKGVTSGVTDTLFAPNASCTRAQMVTFLWRANGSPVVDYAMNFTDVPADAYYADAVRWAVSKGITSGTSATTFAPDMTVTRAQTVTFLYRAAGTPAVSGGSFADVDANAYYADAVAWAVSEGITSGTSATTFSPDAACTRGQIVTFLYRAQ